MDIDYRSEENQNIKSGVAGIGCEQRPNPTHTSFSTRRIFSLGPTNLNQRSSATILLINGFLVVDLDQCAAADQGHDVVCWRVPQGSVEFVGAALDVLVRAV